MNCQFGYKIKLSQAMTGQDVIISKKKTKDHQERISKVREKYSAGILDVKSFIDAISSLI